MPATAEEAPRLTLADMGGPGAPPDDYVMPPSKGGDAAGAAATPDKGAVQEPPIKPVVAEDASPDIPELDPDAPAKPKDDEPERTLADSMDDPAEAAKKEAAEAKAKEKKDADEAKAAEDRAKNGAPAAERDADLKYDPSAHTHPKTRKIITQFQAAAKTARDNAEAATKRAEAAELKAKDAEEKAKTVAVPKEVDEELKTLRERVRELDITQDPVIQKKYDAKITSNNNSILSVLKSQGFGMVKGEGDKMVENPKAIAELVKGGLTFKNLNPLLKKLDEADLVDEAEQIRDAIRQNNRIAQEKSQEIESWKGDHAKRTLERQSASKQQQETQAAAFRSHTDAILKGDLEALARDFPHINRPADPLPTDTPATKKAKEAAIAEYDTAAKAIEAAVKTLNPEGVPAEKLPELVGRVNANAIKAQVLTFQVLPRLKAELAAARKERDEYKAEVEKIQGAGRLSRQQSSSPGDGAQRGEPQAKTLEEAFTAPGGV